MSSRRRIGGALVAISTLTACETAGGPGTAAATRDASVAEPFDAAPLVDTRVASALVAARPYAWRGPASPADAAPVLIFLHGIGASGVAQDSLYFQVGDEALRRGWVFASPDGTLGVDGRRFWNATDACCGGPRSTIDDVAYLRALLTDLGTRTPVDVRRVAIFGYSNGGFMAERFACDSAESLAAFVALEGGGELDRSRCRPAAAVAALFVHGTADTVVQISGGAFTDTGLRYPPLADVMTTWQLRNNCTGAPADIGARLDVATPPLGAETEKRIAPGCLTAAPLQHFRVIGGVHVPGLTPGWRTPIFEFLEGAFAARLR